MFEKLANIFRIPDLRKRVLFTLGLLAVYRIGAHLPTPGIDPAALAALVCQRRGGLLGFVDLFSGGNLRRLTIFALGIMPYITASIILQLLTVVYEPLARLQKEGELGRKKITQWTRYLTVVLSVMQSFGIAMTLQQRRRRRALVRNPGVGFVLMTVLTLTTGTGVHHVAGRADHRARHRQRHVAADLYRHRGRTAAGMVDSDRQGETQRLGRCSRSALWCWWRDDAVVAFIVFVERSERRIPVQYAKRVVGRKVMGGQSTHLPLRVNSGGVMPVIFASSVLPCRRRLGMRR